MFINPIAFLDESSLQYNSSLLVSLIVLSGELVHPAQLGVTVLTVDVPDHVPPSEHDPVHHLTQMQIDDLIEEEGSPCGSSKPRADQFIPLLKFAHYKNV